MSVEFDILLDSLDSPADESSASSSFHESDVTREVREDIRQQKEADVASWRNDLKCN